jgi:4-aminobutyrate aminotransferase-like enzyme
VPDIVTVAKALGNGFPIAAYVTTDAHAAHYTRPGAATFGGNLVACRAALATLDFHEQQGLGERSTALGNYLMQRLRALQSRHPAIFEVRGKGLMVGVELRDASNNPAAALTDEVLEGLKDAGFLLGKTGPGRNVLAKSDFAISLDIFLNVRYFPSPNSQRGNRFSSSDGFTALEFPLP